MVWPKIIFGLWRRKKRELENNLTIFETRVLNPFHGRKVKENFFLTGSLEDRSYRERHLNEPFGRGGSADAVVNVATVEFRFGAVVLTKKFVFAKTYE